MDINIISYITSKSIKYIKIWFIMVSLLVFGYFFFFKFFQQNCIGHELASLPFFRTSDKILKHGFYAQKAPANIQKFYTLVKFTWYSVIFGIYSNENTCKYIVCFYRHIMETSKTYECLYGENDRDIGNIALGKIGST